ncbi:MAG: hypothetical protein IPK82_26705 [Polyangiaceae bacterium]|nr:hypothetical protein [Polyangiaceae bacterium]
MIARTPRTSRILLALGLVGLFIAADASAAGEKDAEANKLYDAAMNDDYLNVELAKAEKKLQDAIKKCAGDACSPKVLAKVYLGLGVIHFANNKADAAKESFIAGLKIDGSAALDATFKGAEIDKIFDEAKKAAGGSGSSGSGGKGGDTGSGGEAGGGPSKPGGDLKHNPVAEQRTNTPVPIYIEVPADLGVKKVTVRYKPFGATAWKPLDMKKVGDGWGIEIPCTDATTTGNLKYYITADDDAGTVATAGSRNEPYTVAIKNEIDADPPSLPGQKPPKQCDAVGGDCVPGFPGCVDSSCQADADCKGGLFCSKKEGDDEGTCKRRATEGKDWGASCSDSSECKAGLGCADGTCQEGAGSDGPKETKKRLNMISVDLNLDLLLIGSRDLVCSPKDAAGNVSDGSYVCFYTGEDPARKGQFYGVPADQQGTNGVTGGFGYAGVRFGAGFDRQLTQKLNITLGLHVGFAISDFPGSPTAPNSTQAKFGHSQANGFLPFWIEGRAGYNLFGGWVEKMKFKPYGYVGFGVGQVNAGVPVTVCDTKTPAGDNITANQSSNGCPSNGGNGSVFQNVTAYQITGLNYIPIGLGSTFGITDAFGVKAELRVLFMVPTFGVVFQPSIGPVYAF